MFVINEVNFKNPFFKLAEEEILDQWSAVKENFAKSINKLFPISGRRKTLEISNIHYDEGKADVNDIKSQQLAKDQEKTWGIPVYAEFTLRDKETGEVINKSKQKTRCSNGNDRNIMSLGYCINCLLLQMKKQAT